MVARARQEPRRFTLLAALGAALVFVIVVALAQSGPAAHATSGGDAYSVPIVVDTNPDPDIVETTIVADESTVDLGNGLTAHAQTYNGQIPGPEFHLKVGDTVIVHFENHLDSSVTGIHWHGIELSNASDGTPLTQNQVPPGGTFLYTFKVPRPGIYWYHPHHHSSINQVFKGLYGTIIVTDPNEAALQASGALPSAADTHTLALSDTTVCKAVGLNDTATFDPTLPHVSGGALPANPGPSPKSLCETSPVDEMAMPRGPFAAGDIPNIQRSGTSGTVGEGQTVLTNGVNVGGRGGTPSAPGALAAGAKTLNVLAGQGIRFRMGSEATTRFFRLRLTTSTGTLVPLVRVGGQGGLLDNAVVEGGVVSGFDFHYDQGEILIDPGDRADVVAAIPASATGVLTLWTEDFERTGQGFAKIPTVPVAHLNVVGTAGSTYTIANGTPLRAATGDPVETLGAPTGTLLNPATFVPAKPGMSAQDIKLTNTGTSLGVDSILGEHDPTGDYTLIDHPDSNRYAKLGDTLELTVTNMTGAHHPFHLHGFSIQPISLTDTQAGSGPPTPDVSPGIGPSYTFPYHEFKDNVDVPGGYTLKFRVRLDDRPLMDGVTPGGGLGRWVFHCHIFFHASFGMISELDVVAPDGNEKPTVNSNETAVTVNEGQTAVIHGTSHDPDGDAITYHASHGTVADTGGGNWTWSFTTTDGPDESGLIFVTATDSGGHKSQVAFQLNVNNLPPSVSITSPTNLQLFQLADSVPVTAPFTDAGTGDTHTCSIDWGDSVTTAGVVVEAAGSGTCTGSHTYSTGGLKTIKVTVTDDDGGVGSAQVTVDINTPPDCTPVQPDQKSLWPANHKLATITISGATDADGDTVTLTVTGVTQDEPVNGTGDGDTSPDGALVPGHSDQVKLRSERAGNRDGRVYRIAFGGNDGRGGTCTGVVKVGVPHDSKDTAVESAPVNNSL